MRAMSRCISGVVLLYAMLVSARSLAAGVSDSINKGPGTGASGVLSPFTSWLPTKVATIDKVEVVEAHTKHDVIKIILVHGEAERSKTISNMQTGSTAVVKGLTLPLPVSMKVSRISSGTVNNWLIGVVSGEREVPLPKKTLGTHTIEFKDDSSFASYKYIITYTVYEDSRSPEEQDAEMFPAKFSWPPRKPFSVTFTWLTVIRHISSGSSEASKKKKCKGKYTIHGCGKKFEATITEEHVVEANSGWARCRIKLPQPNGCRLPLGYENGIPSGKITVKRDGRSIGSHGFRIPDRGGSDVMFVTQADPELSAHVAYTVHRDGDEEPTPNQDFAKVKPYSLPMFISFGGGGYRAGPVTSAIMSGVVEQAADMLVEKLKDNVAILGSSGGCWGLMQFDNAEHDHCGADFSEMLRQKWYFEQCLGKSGFDAFGFSKNMLNGECPAAISLFMSRSLSIFPQYRDSLSCFKMQPLLEDNTACVAVALRARDVDVFKTDTFVAGSSKLMYMTPKHYGDGKSAWSTSPAGGRAQMWWEGRDKDQSKGVDGMLFSRVSLDGGSGGRYPGTKQPWSAIAVASGSAPDAPADTMLGAVRVPTINLQASVSKKNSRYYLADAGFKYNIPVLANKPGLIFNMNGDHENAVKEAKSAYDVLGVECQDAVSCSKKQGKPQGGNRCRKSVMKCGGQTVTLMSLYGQTTGLYSGEMFQTKNHRMPRLYFDQMLEEFGPFIAEAQEAIREFITVGSTPSSSLPPNERTTQ